MKEQLIEFDTAKLAKDKGFNIRCDNAYFETLEHTVDDPRRSGEFTFPYQSPRTLESRYRGDQEDEYTKKVCEAPTQSLLQKWLREKHSVYFNITPQSFRGHVVYYNIEIAIPDMVWDKPVKITGKAKETYESTLEKGLQEALKLIEL